jgi:hypothetical protein
VEKNDAVEKKSFLSELSSYKIYFMLFEFRLFYSTQDDSFGLNAGKKNYNIKW